MATDKAAIAGRLATLKRAAMLGFLTRPEMPAVLGRPGEDWSSQRVHLLLAVLYNTGARVSEMIGVRVVNVILDGGARVHPHGKVRKL